MHKYLLSRLWAGLIFLMVACAPLLDLSQPLAIELEPTLLSRMCVIGSIEERLIVKVIGNRMESN